MGNGIWISREEIAQLPMSGKAWETLKSQADHSAGTPQVNNQDQDNNVYVLAKALVYVRTGDEKYRSEVRANCMAAIDTELGGRTLALGRELAAYVIAADLVGLEPAEDYVFRAWLCRCLTEELDGRTLVSTHEDRANNWGTHAGASRAAVAVFLGDRTTQLVLGMFVATFVYCLAAALSIPPVEVEQYGPQVTATVGLFLMLGGLDGSWFWLGEIKPKVN